MASQKEHKLWNNTELGFKLFSALSNHVILTKSLYTY